MCVIIVKGSGVALPNDSVFNSLWNTNKDGGGFCVARNNKVIGQKGFTDAPTFVKAIRDTVALEDTAVIHMRIGTHGSKLPAATHPFPASNVINDLYAIDWSANYGIAHNGTITGYGTKVMSGLSDTQEFIQKVLSDELILYALFSRNHRGITHLVEEALFGDRLAIMRRDGQTLLVGKFHERDGLYYSNEGYKTAYYSHGSKEKATRKASAYIAEKNRTEKFALAPGRSADKDAPSLYGKDEDGIWHPVCVDDTCIEANNDPSPYGLCICPTCGESTYKSQVFTICGVPVCPHCSEDTAAKANSFTVSYTLNGDNKKSTTGKFTMYKDSQYPLFHRLCSKAKEHLGKKAEWSMEVSIPGRDPIEIYSSGKYLESTSAGGFGMGEKGMTVADMLYDDEFFVCPEMNVLVNYGDYNCSRCVHFVSTEEKDYGSGVCGSVSPMVPDAVVGALRVVLGMKLEDMCPYNVNKEIKKNIVTDGRDNV